MWISKAEFNRLIDRVRELEGANMQLVERLLQVHGVPKIPQATKTALKPEEVVRAAAEGGIAIFEDEDEPISETERKDRLHDVAHAKEVEDEMTESVSG